MRRLSVEQHSSLRRVEGCYVQDTCQLQRLARGVSGVHVEAVCTLILKSVQNGKELLQERTSTILAERGSSSRTTHSPLTHDAHQQQRDRAGQAVSIQGIQGIPIGHHWASQVTFTVP